LATSAAEVAARLGAQPGGTLDIRVRMAADRAAAAVWVLVADGVKGSERARPLDQLDRSPTHRHISIHATADEGRQVLDRLLAGHLERGGQRNDVTWTNGRV
jgi:hypothetical protein